MPRTSEEAAQNSQQYTIINLEGFTEAAASFIYRGFLISFSTVGYTKKITQTKVLVTNNNGNGDVTHEFETVESAIVNINNWLETSNTQLANSSERA